jgi:hypothetical protein
MCRVSSRGAERCICGDIWYSRRDISKNEQYGITAGMSMAVVHCILNPCLLVLHYCLVVSTLTAAFVFVCLAWKQIYYWINATKKNTLAEK